MQKGGQDILGKWLQNYELVNFMRQHTKENRGWTTGVTLRAVQDRKTHYIFTRIFNETFKREFEAQYP